MLTNILMIASIIHLILSGMYACYAWDKESKPTNKAILYLLFTNTVFQFYTLFMIMR